MTNFEFSRLTPECHELLVDAQRQALSLGFNDVGPEHVLLALTQGSDLASRVLAECASPLDIRVAVVRRAAASRRERSARLAELQATLDRVQSQIIAIKEEGELN